MSLIKYVLWERKLAFQQADYISKKMHRLQELKSQGLPEQECMAMIQKEFPVSPENVGRKMNRFKLQDRFKGAAASRRKKAVKEASRPRLYAV